MRVKLDNGAKLPTRAFPTDAGLDIYALHDGVVRAGKSATFRTGVHIQLYIDAEIRRLEKQHDAE